MPKILDGSCQSSHVTYQGARITPVTILSKGIGQSDGIIILQAGKAYYLPNLSGDIESTLALMADAISNIITTVVDIGAAMTGPSTAPPPALGSDIALLNANISDINSLKAGLK